MLWPLPLLDRPGAQGAIAVEDKLTTGRAVADRTNSRTPEIDWLKGLAILGVILIHAAPLRGTVVHEYLVNRAVPVFLVLFGMNAASWWQHRNGEPFMANLRQWYVSRFHRLALPWWSALALWWAFMLVYPTPATPPIPMEPRFLVATSLGYAPWVGTSWFVTVVIQLIVVFPLLYWLLLRLGPIMAAGLAGLVTAASHLLVLHVLGFMQALLLNSAPEGAFYYMHIFGPQYLWPVACGVYLALLGWQDRPRLLGVALVVWLAGVILHSTMDARPIQGTTLMAILDVPFTLVLLRVIQVFNRWQTPADLLAWCGEHSWGFISGRWSCTQPSWRWAGGVRSRKSSCGAGLTRPRSWLERWAWSSWVTPCGGQGQIGD